jgi:hypothetical protein
MTGDTHSVVLQRLLVILSALPQHIVLLQKGQEC